MSVDLKVLGPIRAGMVGDPPGRERLTQPRPLALLAYLALARPRGPHSRDSLVALLWPDADHVTGRQGLRNALHRIRTGLDPDLIVTTGETLVAVDHSRIVCDALDFWHAVEDQDWERAVALYTGELLQGFHVGGAPNFEHWLDTERERLRYAAVSAAGSLAVAATAAGDVSGALAAARTACDLAPHDERSLRQLLDVMVAAGDRAAALRVFEEFAKRLERDLGVEPSAATQAAVRAIRAGDGDDAFTGPAAAAPTTVATFIPPARATAATSPTATKTRRPRLTAMALVAVALAAVWLVTSLPVLRGSAPEDASALDPFAAVLANRWRADTTHLTAYLRARAQMSEAEITEARLELEALVKEAPLFAPGWAGLSVALYRSGFQDIPPEHAMPQAIAAANRALALDPALPDAVETQIAYDLFYRWDLASAKQRLDDAIAAYPDYPEFYNLMATWHRFRGEVDAALDVKEENLERDPLSPRYAYQIGQSLYFAHRCGEAEAVYRRLPVEIRMSRGTLALYRSLACQGKEDEAAAVLREDALQAGDTLNARMLEPPLSPESRARAVEAVFRGRLEEGLAKRRDAWWPSDKIMLQYAEMHNADSTLAWLDSMYVERSMMLYVVPFDPLNDFLRDDPRFRAFVAKLPWLAPKAYGATE